LDRHALDSSHTTVADPANQELSEYMLWGTLIFDVFCQSEAGEPLEDSPEEIDRQ
jgi:hypothetical protein